MRATKAMPASAASQLAELAQTVNELLAGAEGRVMRFCRTVEHAEIAVTLCDQVIHQSRFSAADVNARCLSVRRCPIDQLQ